MFWMPGLIKSRSINLTRTAGTGSSSLLTSHSFSSVSIGTAAPDREVIVVLAAWSNDNGSNTYTESCTVNGNAATLVTRINVGTRSLSIYRINVPSGTTATISATYNDAVSCQVYVYSLTGAKSTTPYLAKNQNSGLPGVTFTNDVLANSASLMAVASKGITGTSHSWSGSGFSSPTTVTGGYNGLRGSAARDEHQQAGTSLTFTSTFSETNGAPNLGVFALWQ